MRLGRKRQERWSRGWEKHGRKNGYLAKICYSDFYKVFYFVLYKGDSVFNSLWENMKYSTEQECLEECEKYINAHPTEKGGAE